MARKPKYTFDVLGKVKVGWGFKVRNGVYYVRFANPSDPAKYLVITTERTTEGEAYQEAAKIILKHYAPDDDKRTGNASWETIFTDLRNTSGLRPRSLDIYESTLRILREHVKTAGPADITHEVAQRFRSAYATGTFSRSTKSDAKQYSRSAKTVENAIRRLSGLWNKYLTRHGYAATNPWANIERPTIPKKVVKVPTEDVVKAFRQWVRDRYPEWPLIHAVLDVKQLAVCRTMDLCGIRSADLDTKAGTLTIRPEGDKTHRERSIPLPADLCGLLARIKGPTYLWERYTEDAKRFRPGTRNRDTFTPKTLFWCINNLFREWNEAHPGQKINPHDLRRRGITLTVMATGGNVDAAAQAIGVDPSTARKHYLDAKQAFDGADLMKRMADVLRPKD